MATAATELPRLDPAKIDDIDLTSDELRQQVQTGLVQQWATREPFYVLSRGIVEVVICRHKDVFEVLNDRERFTATLPPMPGVEHLDHFNGAEHLGRMDGERHDEIRKVMNPPFAPPALAPHEDAVRAIFDEKIDRILAKGGDFDAMADLCSDLIKRVLLGLLLKLSPEQQAVMERLHSKMGLVMQTEPGQPHPAEFTEAYMAARDSISDIIAQRRREPADDFIGRLVASRDAGGVVDTDDTILGNTVAIIAAGLGSTATSLGAALMTLCRNQDQFTLLKQQPDLLKSAIEECLRIHGPGFFSFPRFAAQDTEVGGTFIPKYATVHIAVQAACYDPDVFEDPLRFDVTRNPKNAPVFGAGPHHCLGNRLARFIMKVGLEQVIARLPTLRLVDPDFVPVYTGMFSETAPREIPLTIN